MQVLAEKRRLALKDTLEENKELAKRNEKLEEESRIYKLMLDEARALIEVLQVILYSIALILYIRCNKKKSIIFPIDGFSNLYLVYAYLPNI